MYYALFLAAVGAFFSWSVPRHTPTDILAAFVTVTLVGTALLAALNLLSRWLILPIRARRIFQQQKNLQRPYRVSWDAENVQTSSTSGSSKIPWADFLKWRESKQLFLLYRSDVLFQMYPKRYFTPEQVNEFRSLAKRNIAEVAGRKRKGN